METENAKLWYDLRPLGANERDFLAFHFQFLENHSGQQALATIFDTWILVRDA